MVAAAVQLAGGPSAVAELCGVSRQSVYWWIKEWKLERLVDALKSSRASGVPIEKLAAESIDPDNIAEPRKAAIKRTKPASESRRPKISWARAILVVRGSRVATPGTRRLYQKAAKGCGVSNAAIHKWIQRGSISLLVHALRLSRATGVPIEEFAAEEDDQS
jgi:DNA-binding transcriptional regulator YdaS (Cro superfamily)